MKTFKDLEFKEHRIAISAKKTMELYPNLEVDLSGDLEAKQARMKFDNGIEISVIFGNCFYSNGIDTYETMLSNEDEPQGYLTKEEVTKVMAEAQK